LRLAVKNFLIAATVAALFAGVIPVYAQPAKQPASKSKSAHHKHRRSRKGAWKRHGQQKIDAARATEIQQALIREKYLDGSPSGKWDAYTEAAMARYQADNGWQAKVTPDSRALIKLGLGPNHQSDLQNPDTKPSADSIASTVPSSSTSASKRQ
jgi:hypothetical protein